MKEITKYIFDSRSLGRPEGVVFCALRSEGADGHRFLGDVYARGVREFIVEEVPEWAQSHPDARFVKVESVFGELECLASERRKAFGGTVIGITGSQGKTVVKEMLYQAMQGQCWRSPRSWNSRLGVPMSLLEMPLDAPAAIVECGIDRPGDMAAIERIVSPNIGVITSITDEHSEGFESRGQKIREKLLLFKNSHTIIYNATDHELDRIVKETYPDRKLIAVNGADNDEINRKIVEAIVGKPVTHRLVAVKNRLDVHEGVNDCVMVYDGFTHDLRSLESSLDFMRRRSSPQRTATVIMSRLFNGAGDYTRLGQMLEAYGVTRLIGIGDEISDSLRFMPPSVKSDAVAGVDEFLENYDINRFSSETILIFGDPQDGFGRIRAALESPRHDTVFEINLDSIVHNFNYYRSLLKPTTGLVGMVKASAYGTGALEVSRTLQAQGAAYLAVAVIDEGVELRRGGISLPIMVLNPVTTNYKALFTNNLEPSVFSLRELHTLVAEARKAGVKEFKAHIKLDTGMHRVGFVESEIDSLLEALAANPELRVASVFSHLATADCPDQTEYTQMQLDTFERVSSKIKAALPYEVKRHVLNTAGIMTHAAYQYDMVRLGIGLYGVSPLEADHGDLRTVATLKSTIISLKHWPAGTTIGYARRGVLTRESVIATVPIGYADGVDRHLSRGNASFIVRGVACPTEGNICMDQCMIDVTDVPGVAIGDEVEIFGTQQRVETLAEILDTIPYELLTSVSPRVKRIYYRD